MQFMAYQITWKKVILAQLIVVFISLFFPLFAAASDKNRVIIGNFGLAGILDLPTARRFPDGELILTQQIHKTLARSGISFQALPRVGVSFRYTGHGIGGLEANGRINHDRSFDAHISVLNEGKYIPQISLGLRDFIGTGWYSSEYIVGTKSIGNLEITAGLGFGRLAGRNTIANPFSLLSSRFDNRSDNSYGKGGTFGAINWFQGDAAAFYGIQYHISDKITVSSEYTSDSMLRESSYLNVKSPLNFGASYQLNDYVNLSAQYLHGSQLSFTAHVSINPSRPPLIGGKELAPVPMRLPWSKILTFEDQSEVAIRKVLKVDGFEIHNLVFYENSVNIVVKNTKFRSTAQSLGRLASTLQRFTSDEVKVAKVSFISRNIVAGSYHIDLEKVTTEQFNSLQWLMAILQFLPWIFTVLSLSKTSNFSLGAWVRISPTVFSTLIYLLV